MTMPNAGRRVVAVWAGLCLAGLTATCVLSSDPYADGPEFPAEEPTPAPTGSHSYDCEEIADEIARERAEAAREPALPPSPGAVPVQTLRAYAVPEDCRDELDAPLGVNSP
ncbi:hypothetical protein J7I94_27805 [Streptomyces sp. ISL-12]|uniref:hypothetical protein n=1 Tax=Streptomyces sp. ISL-12 TaxID=2819177 RepID=UPI001BE9AFC6|nr:hypothetical protein [Streptomyces sp. ISL-12]MBT2414306.1 hypothetical protein [Streptomyces sp. ISL-12]